MAEPTNPVLVGNPLNKTHEIVLGAGDTHAMPLPVFITRQGMLSRWVFTDEEIAWITQHRCIYLFVASAAHPPVELLAEAVGTTTEGDICTIERGNDPLERLSKL